jgi:Arc/MetJ-type ribon-helix-helix transcriptional regulator
LNINRILKGTGVNASAKVSPELKKLLETAIFDGQYLNLSDYVRHAVREKLERQGYIKFEIKKGKHL